VNSEDDVLPVLILVPTVCSSPLHGVCMLCRGPRQWRQQRIRSSCAQFMSRRCQGMLPVAFSRSELVSV